MSLLVFLWNERACEPVLISIIYDQPMVSKSIYKWRERQHFSTYSTKKLFIQDHGDSHSTPALPGLLCNTKIGEAYTSPPPQIRQNITSGNVNTGEQVILMYSFSVAFDELHHSVQWHLSEFCSETLRNAARKTGVWRHHLRLPYTVNMPQTQMSFVQTE